MSCETHLLLKINLVITKSNNQINLGGENPQAMPRNVWVPKCGSAMLIDNKVFFAEVFFAEVFFASQTGCHIFESKC